ncbi:MAG TPA: MarC family protein [Caulobacteraceae bacterium]|jgi:multiple antibiotic resistance protein|nr:MarC family protein [Caulobacteraceae bacterium]
MAALFYVFLVFLVTLGPARIVPAFADRTAGASPAEQRRSAIKAAGFATAVILAAALIGMTLRDIWRTPWAALSIAGGVILLPEALRLMRATWAPNPDAPRTEPPPASLEGPAIITPYGVVAVLLFAATQEADDGFRAGMIALLLTVMALDLFSMLNARRIMRVGAAPLFRASVWVLAPVLAALAIQAIAVPAATFAANYLLSHSDDGDDTVNCQTHVSTHHHPHLIRTSVASAAFERREHP